MSKTPATAGVLLAPEDIEKAIAYLQGMRDEDEDLTHVIRYKDVLKWLKIHRRTLDHYLKMGYLKRVYGGGRKKALGVSRESFLEFMKKRVKE